MASYDPSLMNSPSGRHRLDSALHTSTII